MAKTFKQRLEALEEELKDLQNTGTEDSEGLARVVKEMRKALTRARENGDIDKL